MPNPVEMASHCLVRWEDDANQFAVVDTKRSKSVSTLKVGLTTCFEGFQRERRRGTILFFGKFLHFLYLFPKTSFSYYQNNRLFLHKTTI
jgi:hypothetical protein